MKTQTKKFSALPFDVIGYTANGIDIYLDAESAKAISEDSEIHRVTISQGTSVLIKNFYSDDGSGLYSMLKMLP